MGPVSRRLNWLEGIFISQNVRFAAALQLAPPRPESQVLEALEETFEAMPCGRFVVAQDEGKKLVGKGYQVNTVMAPKTSIPYLVERNLEEDIAAERSAHSPAIQATLVLEGEVLEEASAFDPVYYCIAIIINVNHSVMDGSAMKAFFAHFAERMKENVRDAAVSTPRSSVSNGSGEFTPERKRSFNGADGMPTPVKFLARFGVDGAAVDWGDFLEEHCQDKLNVQGEQPAYLPLTDHSDVPILKMDDILGADRSTSGVIIRHSPAVHRATKDAATEFYFLRTRPNISFATLHAAAVVETLAARYLKAHSHNAPPAFVITISLLVDLRDRVPEGVDTKNLLQLFGTVTVSSTCYTRDFIGEADYSQRGWADNLIARAAAIKQEMLERIDRGEAHRASLSLARGPSGGYPMAPSATIELSSHGVYRDLPNASASVRLTQRFDGFSGLSLALHAQEIRGSDAPNTVVMSCNVPNSIERQWVEDFVRDTMSTVEAVVSTCNGGVSPASTQSTATLRQF